MLIGGDYSQANTFHVAGKQKDLSHPFQDHDGLPPNPSIVSTVRAHVFLQHGDRYQETQPYPPNLDGSSPDAKVCTEERMTQFHVGMEHIRKHNA